MNEKIKRLCASLMCGITLTLSLGKVPAYAGESSAVLNIASVSKMYVVTAVMQLADRGLVDIDAPVTEYIPDFKMADERYKDITVRMLMNHSSGLMGTIYGGCNLYDEKSSDYHDTFLEKLRTERLKHEPGAFNCYCNDGFTLLEILTERVSGMSFTEYLSENISGPLSLENTGTLWDMDVERQIPIYINGNVRLAHEVPQLIGAGGIMSTAADVCTFGTAFFTGNNILLSEEAKLKMAENNRTGDSAENFGLGWDTVEIADYKKAGVNVLSKGGDTSQHSNLLVAPDEKISVAVLSSGGSSSVCEKICMDLLDVALSEQGINVEHPEKEKPVLSDAVPEKYLSYEGIYADTEKTISISFPDKKYMQVLSVTAETEFEEQYMYAEDGSFVKMNGDVKSGNAIPAQPLQTVTFEEKNGQIYITAPQIGNLVYKTTEKKTDDKVQSAWDARDGVSYYLVSGSASDANYLDNSRLSLHTSELAPGFVNGYVMQDENHAAYDTIIPGSISRDLSDLSVETADGKEYIVLDSLGFRLISEKNIPVFSDDITTVNLTSGEASWYRIEGAKDRTVKLDIPENAAVWVYDRYMNVKYSSHVAGYGYSVPLPEYGMIVFVGETGSSVSVNG